VFAPTRPVPVRIQMSRAPDRIALHRKDHLEKARAQDGEGVPGEYRQAGLNALGGCGRRITPELPSRLARRLASHDRAYRPRGPTRHGSKIDARQHPVRSLQSVLACSILTKR
jgi:hypothetical protein